MNISPEPNPSRRNDTRTARDARLESLGLSAALLREVLVEGLTARRNASPLAPPCIPGTEQWSETHVALRMRLAMTGWRPDDTANYSTVVHPAGSLALTVATGDPLTGTQGPHQPATKHRKGLRTAKAIEANFQLSILGDQPDEEPVTATWVLLFHTAIDELRSELSSPAGQDEGERITRWNERIILSPIPIEAFSVGDDDDDDDDEPPTEIDVPIERR